MKLTRILVAATAVASIASAEVIEHQDLDERQLSQYHFNT